MTRLLTIGFTQRSAEGFFGALQAAGVKNLIDIRLHNTSQLSGFAKQDDLRYFLDTIAGIGYRHEPLLAPTEEILSGYRKKAINWAEYDTQFLALLKERGIARHYRPSELDDGCLLCSEAKPTHCHRRLVAEYLQQHWPEVEIVHL